LNGNEFAHTVSWTVPPFFQLRQGLRRAGGDARTCPIPALEVTTNIASILTVFIYSCHRVLRVCMTHAIAFGQPSAWWFALWATVSVRWLDRPGPYDVWVSAARRICCPSASGNAAVMSVGWSATFWIRRVQVRALEGQYENPGGAWTQAPPRFSWSDAWHAVSSLSEQRHVGQAPAPSHHRRR
jgi:hypothetical protein